MNENNADKSRPEIDEKLDKISLQIQKKVSRLVGKVLFRNLKDQNNDDIIKSKYEKSKKR